MSTSFFSCSYVLRVFVHLIEVLLFIKSWYSFFSLLIGTYEEDADLEEEQFKAPIENAPVDTENSKKRISF